MMGKTVGRATAYDALVRCLLAVALAGLVLPASLGCGRRQPPEAHELLLLISADATYKLVYRERLRTTGSTFYPIVDTTTERLFSGWRITSHDGKSVLQVVATAKAHVLELDLSNSVPIQLQVACPLSHVDVMDGMHRENSEAPVAPGSHRITIELPRGTTPRCRWYMP